MANSGWNWIPNKGIDGIYFGDPIDKHIINLGLVPEDHESNYHVGLNRYAFPNADGYVDCQYGKVVMISTVSKLMYNKINIIGLKISELVSLLNFSPYEIEESDEHDEGDILCSILFEDLGLFVAFHKDDDIVTLASLNDVEYYT